MPNWHDDDCDCAECTADEDRFWREQGERGDDFDLSDVDDDTVHLGYSGSLAHVPELDDEHEEGPEPEDDLSW